MPEPVVPMSLFRERTVVLAVLASMVVGVVMFGGSVFLGQYFQIGRAARADRARACSPCR